MRNQKDNLTSITAWLLPSGTELALLVGFSLLTVATHNTTFFRNVIFLPQNFQLKSAVLNSLSNLLQLLVGDHIARSAVVAIFWALVGLFVYILIWLTMNFSSELSNDLALTKWVHPRNIDTRSPLRNFLSRVSFQLVVLFFLIFYLNLIVGSLLPYIGGMFHIAIRDWPRPQAIKYALVGVVIEMVVLHVFVVLVRTVTLRKRVFG